MLVCCCRWDSAITAFVDLQTFFWEWRTEKIKYQCHLYRFHSNANYVYSPRYTKKGIKTKTLWNTKRHGILFIWKKWDKNWGARPGLEPGALRPKRRNLPLDYQALVEVWILTLVSFFDFLHVYFARKTKFS